MHPANDYVHHIKLRAFQHICDKYKTGIGQEPRIIFRSDLISESKAYKDADPETRIHKASMAFINEYEKRIIEHPELMDSICVSSEAIIDDDSCVEASKVTKINAACEISSKKIQEQDLKVMDQAVTYFEQIIKNHKANNKWKLSYAERNQKISNFRKLFISKFTLNASWKNLVNYVKINFSEDIE